MKCETCGKEHDGSFGSGRFCCRACANTRKHSEETKQKIGLGLHNSDKVSHVIENYLKNPNYCKICNKRLNYTNTTGYCSRCYSHLPKSEEQRLKQSKIMKERGYPRWHIHRNEPSYAEKFFMTVLKNNNIDYDFDYQVKNNRAHFYILDFFIKKSNVLIDLEIDGKQHTYEDRKQHDMRRDSYLKSKGYIIYRISWNEINSEKGKLLMKSKIDEFLDFYNSI